MEDLRRRIGRGFRDHDFEVVLSTDVVNGISGEPQILATAVRLELVSSAAWNSR
jgi:hypothetical protein